MPLLLPNLDDRTWADLVDEGRALIPVYGPEWTDHNAHDPGITLVELLAWVAEMDIYQLNQISDRERLKFLALVGVVPHPPRPARAVLRLGVPDGSLPLPLPAGLEFVARDPFEVPTRYRILESITVAPVGVDTLQSTDAAGLQNLTPDWRRGAAVYPFGPSPLPNAAFYLGLTAALPVDVPVQIFFTFADGHSGTDERERLLCEAHAIEEHCRPPHSENPCRETSPESAASPAPQPATPSAARRHHGVRTVWEYAALVGGHIEWLPLDEASGEVEDTTRALTLDGGVTVRVPGPMAAWQLGAVPTRRSYLRCRIAAGRHDAAPVLRDVALNGVRAEQAVPFQTSFVIDPTAKILHSPAGPPQPYDSTTLTLELDARSAITRLAFSAGGSAAPEFVVLDYRAPHGATAGRLTVEAAFLGFGNGFPRQQVTLPSAPIDPSSLRLFTLENTAWHAWYARTDFDASMRTDFHFVVDPTSGVVTFGDGEHGRVPPEIRRHGREKCLIVAFYRTTRAEAGNLAAGTINQLADSPHNLTVAIKVPDGWPTLKSRLAVTNPLAASGGAPAETVERAAGRADRAVESSGRATTRADYEWLALRTPGTRITRATAIPNLHPSFPCFRAPGMVTLILLPHLPKGRPAPTPGLLQAVAAHVRRRRIIGTRVEVVGPTYLEVTVAARVRAKPRTNAATLERAIVKALNDFLDPLIGGPEATGWPFGRWVYRSEIMRVIDEVPGVDYVVSLDLIADGCEPQCGNVCLGPTWLVAPGAHRITVV
jgi:predicted phage baseplate assembly protein